MTINLFPGQLKTEIPGHADRIFQSLSPDFPRQDLNQTKIIIRVDAEILGKGETQTVSSIIYANIIRVKYAYTATVLLVGDVPVAEEERWFARGIGVIRSCIVNLVTPATIINETTRAQVY